MERLVLVHMVEEDIRRSRFDDSRLDPAGRMSSYAKDQNSVVAILSFSSTEAQVERYAVSKA